VALGVLFWTVIAAAVRSPDSQPVATSTSAPAFETVQLQSKLIGRTLPYNVILPRDYHTSPRTRYPVLYLLHGFTDTEANWFGLTGRQHFVNVPGAVDRANAAGARERFAGIVGTSILGLFGLGAGLLATHLLRRAI